MNHMKTPAKKHNYMVVYRRVPDGYITHSEFKNRSVQEIMEVLLDIEADAFETEVLSITLIS